MSIESLVRRNSTVQNGKRGGGLGGRMGAVTRSGFQKFGSCTIIVRRQFDFYCIACIAKWRLGHWKDLDSKLYPRLYL